MEKTKITKEVKILMLNILKKGYAEKEDKQELVNKLDLSMYCIEVIDKREQVHDLTLLTDAEKKIMLELTRKANPHCR